jgi:nicotinate-nucleotide--dimethylbenzimidazole phosphoribosyltransferase
MKELDRALMHIEDIDSDVYEKVQKRLDNLTKPVGSLGRLEGLARKYVAITGRENPRLDRKVIFTMAADHGVAEEGVSAYPSEVTAQMVYNFLSGGAAINVLARYANAEVMVVDMGVAHEFETTPGLIDRKISHGTKNMAKGPAMDRQQALQALKTGIELVEQQVEQGLDIIGTGDMGIANTTPSSALLSVFTGHPAREVTGRGTGINDQTLTRKIESIEKAIKINAPDPEDPIDVLAKVGGFEIGGIAGLIIGAAANRIPVVVDGFISSAGALVACKLEPKIGQYLIASHNSAEMGHRLLLEHLGLNPLLNLDLRLGEGTGAALAIQLVEASLRILTEMATFGEAGVSEAE